MYWCSMFSRSPRSSVLLMTAAPQRPSLRTVDSVNINSCILNYVNISSDIISFYRRLEQIPRVILTQDYVVCHVWSSFFFWY